jgi:hypothetical protein
MLSKKLCALVALSMITASSAAAAQSARPLSLANTPAAARAGADAQGANSLENRGSGYGIYFIGAAVIAAIVYGIIKLTDNKKTPASP